MQRHWRKRQARRGSDPHRRLIALKRLQQSGAAGGEPLLVLLQERMRTRRRLRSGLMAAAWLLVPASILMMPGVLLGMCSGATSVFYVACLVWAVNWLLYVASVRLPMTARQREITAAFADINDVRAIGPLLEALGTRPAHDPAGLRTALIRLLRQVQPADAGLLTNRQHGILYRQLAPENWQGKQIDFVLAILHALEQVGTMEALPYVGRLARGAHPRQAPASVVQAAWHCLDLLFAQGGERTTRQTLLRASHPREPRPDTLLRPASTQPDVHSAELLRPDDLPSDAD